MCLLDVCRLVIILRLILCWGGVSMWTMAAELSHLKGVKEVSNGTFTSIFYTSSHLAQMISSPSSVLPCPPHASVFGLECVGCTSHCNAAHAGMRSLQSLWALHVPISTPSFCLCSRCNVDCIAIVDRFMWQMTTISVGHCHHCIGDGGSGCQGCF